MSSITFPAGSIGPSSSASVHEQMEYFSSSFETTSNASFQMNPLSSHPPRTPRTSTASSSHIRGTDIYGAKEETQEQSQYEADDVSDDEDETEREVARNKVPKGEVWKELFTTASGRDKTFKLMQYSLRMYLLFHTTVTSTSVLRGSQRSLWEAELFKRMSSAISGFSLSRKLLILFNWLAPLNSILAQHSTDPYTGKPLSKSSLKAKPLLHTFLHTSPPVLLELVNGVSDDIATFSKLGLIGKRLGDRAGQFADWCWFASTLVNLVENSVERSVILDQQQQVESRLYSESMLGATSKSNPSAHKVDHKELERLQRQDYWIQVSRMKLCMDLIYVSYNVFRLKKAKGSVQTVTGLAAAALSTAKLYERHKTSLVKALKY